MRRLRFIAVIAASVAIAASPAVVQAADDDPGGGSSSYVATWHQWGPDGDMFCWALIRDGAYVDGACYYD